MVGTRLASAWRGLGLNALAFAAIAVLPGSAIAAEPATAPTFTKDIASIFQTKCQDCHEPGSIAPMSLITYQESRPWARSIRERVSTRQMPPWHIDRSVGVQKFKNDMSLTDAQLDTIVRWVDQGALEGNAADMPAPKPVSNELDVKSALSKLTLGEADAVVVYVTDVKSAGGKVTGVEVPAAQNVVAIYPIAVVKASKNLPAAEAFVDEIVSGSGQQALQARGFLPPG